MVSRLWRNSVRVVIVAGCFIAFVVFLEVVRAFRVHAHSTFAAEPVPEAFVGPGKRKEAPGDVPYHPRGPLKSLAPPMSPRAYSSMMRMKPSVR